MAAPHIFPPDTAALDARKRALRARQRQSRRPLDAAGLDALHSRLTQAVALCGDMAAIAGFLPIGTEPDLTLLLSAWAGQGRTVLLPITPRDAGPLRFGRWRPGQALVAGRFGTREPRAGPDDACLPPTVVLVPLLAFDASLHRLGYGGGFYDRTLAGLPEAMKIGVASEALRVDEVPTGPHDMPLDMVATEARMWTRG